MHLFMVAGTKAKGQSGYTGSESKLTCRLPLLFILPPSRHGLGWEQEEAKPPGTHIPNDSDGQLQRNNKAEHGGGSRRWGRTKRCQWRAKGWIYLGCQRWCLLSSCTPITLHISTWKPVLHPRTTLSMPVGFYLISEDGENIQPTDDEKREADGGTSSWLHCHPEIVDGTKGEAVTEEGMKTGGQGAVSSNTAAMWWGHSHSHAQRKPLYATTWKCVSFPDLCPTPGWLQHPNPLGVRGRPWTVWAAGRWRCLSTQSWNPGKSPGRVSRALWPSFPSSLLLLLFLLPWMCCIRIWGTVTFQGLECSPMSMSFWAHVGGKAIESNAVQAEGKLPPCRVRFRGRKGHLRMPLSGWRKELDDSFLLNQ